MSSSPLMAADSTATSETPFKPLLLKLNTDLSLEIRDNSLIITNRAVSRESRKARRSSCCGIESSPDSSSGETVIPLYNILWTIASSSDITIISADTRKKDVVSPQTRTFSFPAELASSAASFSTTLLASAYGSVQPQKRFKVLINPFGGQGAAVTIFNKHCRAILQAAQCELDIQHTEYNGQAVEIARDLDISKYDAILCCSGDGIPHEVFNGLAKRADARTALRKIAVAQLPGGSGNAMAWNLTGTGSPSLATLAVVKSRRQKIDLISITQGDERKFSFLSQSFGIVAECDLGTEHLRWLGEQRFLVGLLSRIVKQTVYPCDLAVKVAIEDKELIRNHYQQRGQYGSKDELNREVLHETAGEGCANDDQDDQNLPELKFGTVNDPLPEDWELVHHPNMGNFYAGNMAWMSAGANFFPASLPNDEMFDLICVDGKIGRWNSLKMVTSVETGKHFELPSVVYRKVLGYRIIPHDHHKKGGYISIDGESIPFEPFQAEVHSGLGTVLVKGDKNFYHAPGV